MSGPGPGPGPAPTVDGALPGQPLIAVDVVPVSFADDGLRVATAVRRFEPYVGSHALPGVLLGAGEPLVDAARRALATKTGIDDDGPRVRHLFQIGAFDGTDRDPRQHAISIVFVAIVGPEGALPPASTVPRSWWPAGEVPALPFDHDAIVAEAMTQLRTRLWRDDAVTRALTGPVFSTPDAVRLTDEVTGAPSHRSNLRRSLASHASLVSGPTPGTGRPGRRPLAWEWVGEAGPPPPSVPGPRP